MTQIVKYSKENNIVYTEINDVFYKADYILGWNQPSYGIGLNLDIINKCHENHSDLVVRIHKGILKGVWIITNQDLFDFIESYNTEYVVKSHYTLKVIAANWFKCYEGALP